MNGIGANLHYLSGGSKHGSQEYEGKVIEFAVFNKEDNYLEIHFQDGVIIRISDEGQSCCENRYMTCDDDLSVLKGTTLKQIRVNSVEDEEFDRNGYISDVHQIAFLEILTNQNSISFATHVEHNGYYGGFGLNIDEISKEKT